MGVQFSHSPDFIQGGVDGLITTFAVMNGAISTGARLKLVIVLGLVNVIADGFSIGCAKYLSAKAEEELQQKTNPAYERYPSPFSSGVATFFAFAFSGLLPLIPLIVRYYAEGGNVVCRKGGLVDMFDNAYTATSYFITFITLFLLGYMRGKIDGFDPMISGGQVLALGTGAALIALVVGNLFHTSK